MRRKIRRFELRLTEKDIKKLKEYAEDAGMSKSTYLRTLLNNKQPKSREDYLLIRQLVTEVNKIGVNINQIVMHANSEFYNEHEKRKLIALMNTLILNVEKVIHRDDDSGE